MLALALRHIKPGHLKYYIVLLTISTIVDFLIVVLVYLIVVNLYIYCGFFVSIMADDVGLLFILM